MPVPHLFAALSSHGFGHLAQAAPVLNELRRRLPALRLSVQCALPREVLCCRIDGDFELIAEETDFGMVMANALDVDLGASRAAYLAFHAGWTARLAREQALLTRLKPDLVFADIPYLPLAAAARVSIPAVALCSLNWADVLRAYYPGDHELAAVRDTMLDAYHGAARFLCPAPSMSMPDLTNTQAIGPIAAIGRDRRAQIHARLGLSESEILVLVGLGGIDYRLPIERWAEAPGVRWLVPAAWGIEHGTVSYLESLADMPFLDLLRSCDVLLTKSGYGSFAEAVCNDIPVLYLKRPDWPEEPGLSQWLRTHGNALDISLDRLLAGDLRGLLLELLAQPRRPDLTPDGIEQAVAYLAGHLPTTEGTR